MKLEPELRPWCWQSAETLIDDLSAACSGSAACLAKLNIYGPAPCALIPDEQAFLRPACFSAALTNLRTSSNSERRIADAVCAALSGAALRDECFGALAPLGHHGQTCGKITNLALRDRCLMAAGQTDARYCKALSKPDQARRCVETSKIFGTLDDSVCLLLDVARRKQCVEQVSSNVQTELQRGR
jgi:hypothetical protein